MSRAMAPRPAMPPGTPQREWSRFKFPDSLIRYGIWLSMLVFLAYTVEYLDIPLDRLLGMFGRMGTTIANRYYPPDFDYIMDRDYLEYVIETVQMAYLGRCSDSLHLFS